MKKQSILLFTALIMGTILFNYLFWNEKNGINVLIFDLFIFIIATVFGFRPFNSFLSTGLGLSLFAAALAICWHSSVFTIIMHHINLVLFVGTIHLNKLNSIVFVFSSAFHSFFRFPRLMFNMLSGKKQLNMQKAFRFIRLSLIPLAIIWLFYIIYKFANPVFEELSMKFTGKLQDFFSRFFVDFSFSHLGFILIGTAITGWVLFKSDLAFILDKQSNMSLQLFRLRRQLSAAEKSRNIRLKENAPVYYRKKYALSMKLKYEFISALVLLVMVNILLLFVNIIDIDWLWFGFEYSKDFDLKQFVHEGTYLLIVSILLSIGIMLYFFRRNLNYYTKSKILKGLTYFWIVQNLILAISVAIRNFLYIEYWGLAYKRIGVILFLFAVAYGLFTLFVKICCQKSVYYLIKKNSLAIFFILLISSLFNWDMIIARHNLGHTLENHMETSYLLSLSDKTLPLIEMKSSVLDQDTGFNSYASFHPYTYRDYYQIRVKDFKKAYENRTWKSWNYAEWKAYAYFTKIVSTQ